jgi:hypothetical protein
MMSCKASSLTRFIGKKNDKSLFKVIKNNISINNDENHNLLAHKRRLFYLKR